MNLTTEAAVRRCSTKLVFLMILQNLQKKIPVPKTMWTWKFAFMPSDWNFIIKETSAQVFPAYFVEFLETPFF